MAALVEKGLVRLIDSSPESSTLELIPSNRTCYTQNIWLKKLLLQENT
jgi:hypothetical protein